MNLDILLDKISEKYNYSSQIKEGLRLCLPPILKHYKGLEEIIFAALLETEIIMCQQGQTIYDVVKKYSTITDGTVGKKELIMASGVCFSEPIISQDENGNYSIDDIKRYVAVAHFNGSLNIHTLIHELSHLFKSYLSPYVIEGDKMIERNGLIECIYQLENEQGKTTYSKISEKNVGIEEALTEYDSVEIMRKIKPDFESKAYLLFVTIARKMSQSELFVEKRINEQFYKTGEFIDDDKFDEISTLLDKLVELEYLKYQYTGDAKMYGIVENMNLLLEDIKPAVIDYVENSKKY